MKTVTYNGLTFKPYLTSDEIATQVKRVAAEIKRDCVSDNPVFVCVLNGAFVFAADLYRELNMPQSEITFVRYKSYEGTSSSGEMKKLMGLTCDVADREVIIIEDIVDTGLTARALRQMIAEHNPKSVKMAALLFKPAKLEVADAAPEYVGFSIPPEFIIGYGLDIDELARGLKDIYVLDK